MVTVILDQIGPGQNRCLAFSSFTFKQDLNTKSDQINHFQCILYTFTMHLNPMSYIQYIRVMVYTHFYANKDFFRDYSTIEFDLKLFFHMFGSDVFNVVCRFAISGKWKSPKQKLIDVDRCLCLTLSLIRQVCSRRLWTCFFQKIENLFNWMDNLCLKVENIVAKGEIACFEQFLLLSLCFQKAVCCRGVRKRLYEGKG